MVEQDTHNILDVGSIPTGPNSTEWARGKPDSRQERDSASLGSYRERRVRFETLPLYLLGCDTRCIRLLTRED